MVTRTSYLVYTCNAQPITLIYFPITSIYIYQNCIIIRIAPSTIYLSTQQTHPQPLTHNMYYSINLKSSGSFALSLTSVSLLLYIMCILVKLINIIITL